MYTPVGQRPAFVPNVRPARPKAVVIGAGFGGLAAAIRLGARGFDVTVVDRLEQPGGRASLFAQDGFRFDAGPTIVTAPFLLEELWALCGRRLADDVTLKSMSPFYRILFSDGATFDYSGDAERMRAEVAKFSPRDVAGYERFMARSAETCRIAFEELGHVPFNSVMDMARVLPDLVRLESQRSVYSVVSKYIRDPRLRVVFSFHPLLVGANPTTVTAVYSLIAHLERRWGVHYAMGGTNALVQGMAKLIEGQGGTLRLNAQVEEIVVRDGAARGVRLATGETLPASVVVSNAAASHTYGKLVDKSHRRTWTDRKLGRARHSMGLFVWYFGLNRQYPDVLHHTILLSERYRELLTDIFTRKVLAKDFSLYLHRPSASDPSVAPAGCDAFYVLSPVPNLDAAIDWSTAAEPYRQAIARHLDQTLLPGFERSIVTSKIMTPLEFESRLLSPKGAGFDLEPALLQSAWFRPHNKSEDVENLFLVGAGTHPGAGIPGVLSSARVLDHVVPDARHFV
ncbi:MAG: phytoene desaturase family protein [Hyphomicrobiales bacterium]